MSSLLESICIRIDDCSAFLCIRPHRLPQDLSVLISAERMSRLPANWKQSWSKSCVSHSVRDEFGQRDHRFTGGVARGCVLGFHLATALVSAPEAQASVSLIKRTVDEFVARLRPSGIQLFAACPAALAVVLGHRWNAMPPTQLHEYLQAERRYIQTATLTV